MGQKPIQKKPSNVKFNGMIIIISSVFFFYLNNNQSNNINIKYYKVKVTCLFVCCYRSQDFLVKIFKPTFHFQIEKFV